MDGQMAKQTEKQPDIIMVNAVLNHAVRPKMVQ